MDEHQRRYGWGEGWGAGGGVKHMFKVSMILAEARVSLAGFVSV